MPNKLMRSMILVLLLCGTAFAQEGIVKGKSSYYKDNIIVTALTLDSGEVVVIEGGTIGGLTLGVSDTPMPKLGARIRKEPHRRGVRVLSGGIESQAYGYKWPTMPVRYYVNPANADGLAPLADIVAGADAWSLQSTASLRSQYALGTASAVANDGVNNVFFSPEASGSTIAVTYYWWDGFANMVDADIKFFDGGFRFWTSDQTCGGGQYVLDIATHEFGHVFGLAHTTVSEATMYPSIGNCGSGWRSLSADDIGGIEGIYPPVVPMPPGIPTSPSPADSRTSVPPDADLSWTSAGGEWFDVYFGTTMPPPLVASDLHGTSYALPPLTVGTRYYWQILARNNVGTTAGPVWDFVVRVPKGKRK